MKLQDIFESPQYTFPQEFNLDDDQFNKQETKKILNDKRKVPIDSFGNGTHTLYELPRSFVLIDHNGDSPRIVYIMHFELNFHKFIGAQCAQQILVWRNTKNPYTINLAKNIFFNHLLQNYQLVITDSVQTPDGQRFWDNRVLEAINQNFYVYYISLIPIREIIPIKNYKEYQNITSDKEIWGDNSKHKARRIVISLKPLD